MVYTNFDEDNFDIKSWEELGAKRFCADLYHDYGVDEPVELPEKICEGKVVYVLIISYNN